jgi:hypothetical protein
MELLGRFDFHDDAIVHDHVEALSRERLSAVVHDYAHLSFDQVSKAA